MRLLVFADFCAVVGPDGRNMASFYGALRHVEAALFMRPPPR